MNDYIKDYTDFCPYNTSVEDRRKLNVGDIFMNQIRCKKCNWVIRSKNKHDMQTCPCGSVSIDGGSHYTKISCKTGAEYEDHIVLYKHQPKEENETV